MDELSDEKLRRTLFGFMTLTAQAQRGEEKKQLHDLAETGIALNEFSLFHQ